MKRAKTTSNEANSEKKDETNTIFQVGKYVIFSEKWEFRWEKKWGGIEVGGGIPISKWEVAPPFPPHQGA